MPSPPSGWTFSPPLGFLNTLSSSEDELHINACSQLKPDVITFLFMSPSPGCGVGSELGGHVSQLTTEATVGVFHRTWQLNELHVKHAGRPLPHNTSLTAESFLWCGTGVK